jgi:dCTP deaminase
MIINGLSLLGRAPIKDMLREKINDPKLPGSYGLGELGYDIRIKQDIHFLVNEEGPAIRVGDGPWKPGRFCLASSMEEFQVPNDLGAVGHDKSTFARLGVQVFNTVIEPHWRGFLTLELVFNGEKSVFIPAGSGIMQVLFHSLAEPASYRGKYQDQPNEPVPAKT